MKRTILTYGGYFERFMMTLTLKEQRKVNYILSLLETEDRLPVNLLNTFQTEYTNFELHITVLLFGFSLFLTALIS